MGSFLLQVPNNFSLRRNPVVAASSNGRMGSFLLQVPNNSSLSRNLVVAASSNGAPPGDHQNGGGGGGGPVILELPLDKIRRPLMRTRANDPRKVKDLMDSIRQIGLQVPIDVLEVDGVYYGFSGCHRYEAHEKLGLPTIRCKVRKGTKETLRFGFFGITSAKTRMHLLELVRDRHL
ncbi:ParB/Sulfiredoxin [Dillenia turbinata]|uniref:sulfiredoxin n=1 Tax=Dillenia turbinata TaxID=194707 RepID=A0AAN8Z178_9MAGN